MPIASTSLIERLARILAARALSANAGGEDCSAADRVDASWRDHRDDALSVIRTLREPDEAMAKAGDLAIWERMIEAALGQADTGIFS